MIPPELITGPAVPAVTAADVKAELREKSNDENTRLQFCADAAIEEFDGPNGILGRCLINQTWRLFFTGWQSEYDLLFPDVSAAIVSYVDADGVTQALDADTHNIVRGFPAFLVHASGFSAPALHSGTAYPVMIAVTAGFGATAAAVPDRIRLAIAKLAAFYADQPYAASPDQMYPIPYGIEALVKNYRRIWA